MLINLDNKLILNLKISWAASALLLALHMGALLIAATAPLFWAVRLVLSGLIVVSLYHSLLRYVLHKGRRAICRAELDEAGEWYLDLGNDQLVGPCSVKGYYAKPWLVIVRFAYPGIRLPVSLVVSPDAVAPSDFKNLRVRLNLGGLGT